MDKRSERVEIDADYVLTSIRDIVERCKQAEPVMKYDADSKAMVETGEYKFDSAGALKGLDLLGKHLKLFGADEEKAQGNVTYVINTGITASPNSAPRLESDDTKPIDIDAEVIQDAQPLDDGLV